MVAKFEDVKLRRADAEASAARAEVGGAASRAETAAENHRLAQRRLRESRVELERVIAVGASRRGSAIALQKCFLGRAYHPAP